MPGTEAHYEVPVMKISQYTIMDLFQKKILILITFYIFTYENLFPEYEHDREKLEALKKEYGVIKNKLEELLQEGAISEYTKCTLIDMSNKVLEHLARNYKTIREEVKSVMGGKILDYEAKTIRSEGKLEMLFELVQI